MSSLELQQLIAVLVWAEKHYKIPYKVYANTQTVALCQGSVSKNDIRITVGNSYLHVDRTIKGSSYSNSGSSSWNYAVLNDGSRLQLNLDYNGAFVSGYVLDGHPSGEFTYQVKHDRAIVSYNGSTVTFYVE
jgi:hypothetical protein